MTEKTNQDKLAKVKLPGIKTGELLEKIYLSEKEVAAMTGIAIATLRNDRHLRRGIHYCKVGKKTVKYRWEDVKSYMEQCLITFDEKQKTFKNEYLKTT
ncbi:MAG: hypothetical protein CVU71_07080 [Deltaproteobacteria bacterium HGW-Deltaproteobacteria-6]|jgi:hypothetical protein|nr:MAG: hypothetical protein CVU71_07080 [Deltaproteobacteria bacterium HGW-Deltaproteobacteria-6]